MSDPPAGRLLFMKYWMSPKGVSLEDVIEAFRDFKPAEKTYEYDYAALKA